MNKSTKVFVVEGEDRDLRLLNSLTSVFFRGKYEAKIISLPAQKNIYMLYSIMKNDGFESDFLEILRDHVDGVAEKLDGINRQDVDEIFLFFDFDLHQNNLPTSISKTPLEVLEELICYFDNETENGKLYVNYPMVEATYDFVVGACTPFTECYMPVEKFGEYKTVSGTGNPVASWHFNYNEWSEAIKVFALRIQCFFDQSKIEYSYYREYINTSNILKKQIELVAKMQRVFVLGACPEFLLDYFNEAFWVKHFRVTNNTVSNCSIRE